MSKRKFNPCIGDSVRFREWKDMEKEFGIDRYGDIDCKFSFTSAMMPLCGYEFTIEKIDSNGRILGHGTGFSVSTDMIECVSEELFDTEEINNFLDTIMIK